MLICLFAENKQCEEKSEEINKVASIKRGELEKVTEEMNNMERQITEQERNKQRVLTVINKKNELIETGKTYTETLNKKMDMFKKHKEKISKLLEHFEFYIVT